MNPRAPKSHPIPTPLRKLWREARALVAWLITAVDRSALPTAVISREQGAKVSIWLMNIEAAVRRLILAAALSFTPPAPRTIACIVTRATHKHATTRRPGFCVFRLAGTGDASPAPQAAPAPPPQAEQKPYGHIPFPSDPLLNLGATQRAPVARTPPTPTPHQRHPLDRWVRPTRQDPDWRAPETPSTLFSDPERIPAHQRASRGPRPRRTPHDPNALPPSLYDWRRRYDEWQKLVPAPDLAARIDALTRITANPHAAILSAARRLTRAREAMPLARRAIPRTRVPRHTRHLHTGHRRIDLPDRCHAAIPNTDTS